MATLSHKFNPASYLAGVAALASFDIRRRAQAAVDAANPPTPANVVKRREISRRRRLALSLSSTFPNALGNYAWKVRPEKRPAPRPLTGRERFARLVAAYMGMRVA